MRAPHAALVLTQAPHEGPGLLAAWLPEEGLQLDVVPLWSGAPVPASLWKKSRRFLPNGKLHSPYGATEALPIECPIR